MICQSRRPIMLTLNLAPPCSVNVAAAVWPEIETKNMPLPGEVDTPSSREPHRICLSSVLSSGFLSSCYSLSLFRFKYSSVGQADRGFETSCGAGLQD